MKKTFGIVFGVLLVAAGVIYALDILGIASVNVSFDGWWTLFIIIPSIYGIFTDKDKFPSLTGFAVGILLLLAARGILDYDVVWQLLLTLIIIFIGLKLIIKTLRPIKKTSTETFNGTVNRMSAFSSKKIEFKDKDFKEAKIGALFGGTVCNLIGTKIENGSRLDILCVFGGADIIVPENINIKINTFCLFGGISDKRIVKNSAENPVTLTINGFCMFGGADIK